MYRANLGVFVEQLAFQYIPLQLFGLLRTPHNRALVKSRRKRVVAALAWNDRLLGTRGRSGLIGETEEVRDVIGRRNSGIEEKRSGNAALSIGAARGQWCAVSDVDCERFDQLFPGVI